MRFRVRHLTTYTYSEPVRLGPHRLRLRPRTGDGGELLRFALEIDPPPAGRSEGLDADGNSVTRVWFDGETTRLAVRSEFEFRTAAAAWASGTDRVSGTDGLTATAGSPALAAEPMPWPGPYEPALRRRLAPWLADGDEAPAVQQLALQLREGTRDVAEFLQRLNEWLHAGIERRIRDVGAPQAPEETLRLRRGACRDLAVLFAAVCRCQGLAARFVSGYQARGHDAAPGERNRYMHAWAEVYLAGDGWRGFDPTHGKPVAEAHVALAAAAHPDDAAPLTGYYFGGAQSRLHAEVAIDVDG